MGLTEAGAGFDAAIEYMQISGGMKHSKPLNSDATCGITELSPIEQLNR